MNKIYTLDENEDGSFSFEGKMEKITPDELKTLQELQPESIWILFTSVETYRRIAQERQGDNHTKQFED